MTQDEIYMTRCIELAQNGIYGARPNPMVGAVIVHDGRIIGEGYHCHYGQGHAEVNAIASVKDPGLLRDSTIYVSLEPCSHYGKTPPCADLIIEKQIPRIVVGCRDPFSKVEGRGIKKLRDAGRDVTVGVLEDECRRLNKRFFTFNVQHRPYIILKWAESADGFIGHPHPYGRPLMLSSALTQMIGHKNRAENMAILAGTNTAAEDNPGLNVRSWAGPHPLRIVLDRTLRLPDTLHLFDGTQPTWVFTEREHEDLPNVKYMTTDFGHGLLQQIMDTLYENNIQSVLVEGGAQTHRSFIDAQLWDEAWIEHCPVRVGCGVKAPELGSKGKYSKSKFIMGRKYHIIYNFV